jgi:integrase/recombinase XerD
MSEISVVDDGLGKEITPQDNFVGMGLPQQAQNDDQLIDLWLFNKSPKTQEVYSLDVREFLEYVKKPMRQVILQDLQNYYTYLENRTILKRAKNGEMVERRLEVRSRKRKLAAIKSLFSFGTKLGYIQFDIGKPIKLPMEKDDLAKRILDETSVVRIIYAEKNLRNYLFLKLSYLLGARVSEVVNLTWEDFIPDSEHCTVILFGKGSKTRNVLITLGLYRELLELKKDASPTDPVFRSRKGGYKLTRVQAFRIVQQAAVKAGIDKNVSPHWFRHAHASHALQKGAPMPLIQRDLGHSTLAVTGRYLHAKPTDGSGLYLSV